MKNGKTPTVLVFLTLFFAALFGLGAEGTVLYAAGSVSDGYGEIPAVWEGNELRLLGLPDEYYDGRVLCVAADGRLHSGGVAFGYDEYDCYPMYWDGMYATELSLPDDAIYGSVTGIALADDSTLLCGNGWTEYDMSIPVFWKDGYASALPLESGMAEGLAQGMAVLKGDIWIAGFQWDLSGTVTSAGYWKNGIWNALKASRQKITAITSIHSDGQNIRIGGALDEKGSTGGITWTISAKGSAKETAIPRPKDGKSLNLEAIAGIGGDTWASGSYGDDDESYSPVLWKNGKETRLSGSSGTEAGNVYALIEGPSGGVLAGGYVISDILDFMLPVLWQGPDEEPILLDLGEECFDGQVCALAWGKAGLLPAGTIPFAAHSVTARLSVPDRSWPVTAEGISIRNRIVSFEADNRGEAKRDGVVLDEETAPLKDFTVECTVRSTDGPASYGNGILFRVNESGQGLLFNVTNDGRVAFYDYDVHGDYYQPYAIVSGQTEPKVSLAPVRSGTANELKAVAAGSSVTLSVNGVNIGSVDVDLVEEGRFGIYVSAGNRVDFTDWQVTEEMVP